MRFIKLKVEEGLKYSEFSFSNKTNLIYSKENSQGKTTLIRLLLYALGYPIPSTKGMDFSKCITTLNIVNENDQEIKIVREQIDSLELSYKGNNYIYVLPDDLNIILKLIFQNENNELLDNLLGAFYIDQEKGWTLVNRGYVIAHYGFEIEGLIRGLNNVKIKDLKERIKKLDNNIKQYKKIFNVAKYRDQIEKGQGSLNPESVNKLQMQLNSLQVEKRQLRYELNNVLKIEQDNNAFRQFVEDIGLLIESPKGEEFPLKLNNIKNFEDTSNYTQAMKFDLVNKIKSVDKEIKKIRNSIPEETNQIDLVGNNVDETIKKFSQQLSVISISQAKVREQLDFLQKQKRKINNELRHLTYNVKTDKTIERMFKDYISYAKFLEVEDIDKATKAFLFTDNMKELTGADLHKISFAFKLMYINAINREVNINLPIIIDSPRSGEIDERNTKLIINLLNRKFKDHQIIMASIYNYGNFIDRVIEIHKPIMDKLKIDEKGHSL